MVVAIVLVALLIAGIALFGILGFAILGGTAARQRRAERSAEETLDGLFDGTSDVVYKVTMASLKYETVILGAKQRGYRLAHQEDNQYGPHTLIFEKVQSPDSR